MHGYKGEYRFCPPKPDWSWEQASLTLSIACPEQGQ